MSQIHIVYWLLHLTIYYLPTVNKIQNVVEKFCFITNWQSLIQYLNRNFLDHSVILHYIKWHIHVETIRQLTLTL